MTNERGVTGASLAGWAEKLARFWSLVLVNHVMLESSSASCSALGMSPIHCFSHWPRIQCSRCSASNGPMSGMPVVAGFVAFRAAGQWREVIKAAVTVAVVTQVVFGVANMIRVNLLLDTLSQRSDWQNLVARFRNSDFESFRAYVNYDYARQIAPKLLVVTLIGAVCGILGGVFATFFRGRRSRELPTRAV